MFRFPNENTKTKADAVDMKFFPVIKSNSIKDYINAGVVTVGSKFNICGRDITCVHISGNDYIFSFDDCLGKTTIAEIPAKLEKIYNDPKIIPISLKKEIEYLFIPTEFQIFGKNTYGETEIDVEQFDYYKNNEAHRVKNVDGETWSYWTSSLHSNDSGYFCFVHSAGDAGNGIASYAYGLAPSFVIKSKNENMKGD
jgi:hypothetical protein